MILAGRPAKILLIDTNVYFSKRVSDALKKEGFEVVCSTQPSFALTTIEYDPARAKIAADNVRRAGLSGVVTVVAGDAFKEIPKIAGTFDFVFLDAWKRDYKRFFDLVLPRLLPRGIFLAHNVVNKQSEMRDFLAAIQDPSVMSTIVTPSGEGMSITYKLR